MPEEARQGSACAYVCTYSGAHMHIHVHTCSYTHKHIHRGRQLPPRRCLFFPKEESAVEISHLWRLCNTTGFWLFHLHGTPAEVLPPACGGTRKQHTIRHLSGVPVSLWDRAIEWFFICSFFMLHWPINTPFLQFWALCRAKGRTHISPQK